MKTNYKLQSRLRRLMDFGWKDLGKLGPHKWLEFAEQAADIGREMLLEEIEASMDTRIQSAWDKATELERAACENIADAVMEECQERCATTRVRLDTARDIRNRIRARGTK